VARVARFARSGRSDSKSMSRERVFHLAPHKYAPVGWKDSHGKIVRSQTVYAYRVIHLLCLHQLFEFWFYFKALFFE
jgi:hypothetical protein